jgi:small glutamine-rich tetratricopeptide repeat-containing protein alpha
MSDKRRLIYAFVEFLNREMASDEHSEDAKESLEVASQCLQTAYSMSAQDDKHLSVSKNIEEIFKEATKDEPLRRPGPASAEDKEKAEKFKAEGNEMMKSEQFDKALELYTK